MSSATSGKKMKKVGGVVVKLEHKNVGPTWISKLVQNLLSFMVVTRINSTGKTKKSEELHKLAMNDYSNCEHLLENAKNTLDIFS